MENKGEKLADQQPTSGSTMTVRDASALFHALSHPVRLKIMSALNDPVGVMGLHADDELAGLNAGSFEFFGLSQSTTSTHLKILKELGLVSSRRLGTERIYFRNETRIAELKEFMANKL